MKIKYLIISHPIMEWLCFSSGDPLETERKFPDYTLLGRGVYPLMAKVEWLGDIERNATEGMILSAIPGQLGQ